MPYNTVAPPDTGSRRNKPEHIQTIIIGAGLSGIGLAVTLCDAGIRDFTILERAASLGGTWRDNSYPGCACDVASDLYSFSFAPNSDWSRRYGRQPEILGYLQDVAQRRKIEPFIRYDHELAVAHWDSTQQLWRLTTSQGEFTANVLVTAVGAFGDPVIPELPGLEKFSGEKFHTAHWNHDHNLAGRKVAVIGTGASAVQVIPSIAPVVEKLTVFQRTPIWVLPRMDAPTSGLRRWLLKRLPVLQRGIRAGWYCSYEGLIGLPQFVNRRFMVVLESLGRFQLRRQVADPELRRQLTPNYNFGCKRPAVTDDFYPALARDNVELVSSGISEIREHGIVTADGVEHAVDTLILATGFRVPHQICEQITGRDGQRLAAAWGNQPAAYLGTSVGGFPNLFMIAGPFAGPGSQSYIYMVESQMRYIVDAIRTMRRKKLATLETRPEVMAAFHREMSQRSRDTSWIDGSCSSYYQNADGGNAGLWPHWSFMFRWRTRRFDLQNYNSTALPEVAQAPELATEAAA